MEYIERLVNEINYWTGQYDLHIPKIIRIVQGISEDEVRKFVQGMKKKHKNMDKLCNELCIKSVNNDDC